MPSAGFAAILLLAGCDREPQVDTRTNPNVPVPENLAEPGSPRAASAAADRSAAIVEQTPQALNPNFQALGTEPFWSIIVQNGEMTYSSPENLAGTKIPAQVSVDGPRTRVTGRLEGKGVELLVEDGECSDGMSDTVYPSKATLTWGDRTEQGCARPR